MLPGFGVYKLEAKVTFLHFPVFAERCIVGKILPRTVMIVTNTVGSDWAASQFHFREEELAWEDR